MPSGPPTSPNPRNAKRVSAALKDFNGVEINPAEIKEKTMIELGRRPNALHIITTLTGVEWEKAWTSRVQGEFGDQPAAFLSKDRGQACNCLPSNGDAGSGGDLEWAEGGAFLPAFTSCTIWIDSCGCNHPRRTGHDVRVTLVAAFHAPRPVEST